MARVAYAPAPTGWRLRMGSEVFVGGRPNCQVLEDLSVNRTHRILSIFGHKCDLKQSRELRPHRGIGRCEKLVPANDAVGTWLAHR